ncbi:MAG: outer membrane beta-barrel protein [Pirellulales bacterium]
MKISKWTLGAALAMALWGRGALAQQDEYYRESAPRLGGAEAVIADDEYQTTPVVAQPTGFGTMLGEEACACEEESDECAPPEPFELFPKTCRGIKAGGWTQFGYHNQASFADLFNQNPGNLHLHQQWMYIEKQIEAECGLDWGFRFDAMYGIDANNTQAFGNPPGTWDYLNGFDFGIYGWAFPQLYGEIGNKELSVKVGHFFTPIGYEVVTAPNNFFYSHAFTMNNSEPFTHTGALAKWVANEKVTVYGGWTAGWNTGFTNLNGGSNFIGGASFKPIEEITLTYLATAGNFGWLGSDAYSHSIIADVLLTEKLKYVFQSDMVSAQQVNYDTVGINQYLIYTINDKWAAGARVEWWDNNGVATNAATFGVNWKPHTNLVFRPEVKQEWIPGINADQTIFGVDGILTY